LLEGMTCDVFHPEFDTVNAEGKEDW